MIENWSTENVMPIWGTLLLAGAAIVWLVCSVVNSSRRTETTQRPAPLIIRQRKLISLESTFFDDEAEERLAEVQKNSREDILALLRAHETVAREDPDLIRNFRQDLRQKNPKLLEDFDRVVQKYQDRGQG